MDSGQFTVQAQYSFKGSNNDELCFKKGDIITLTQREDGGWWEGTLGDMTGWFPSNYVKEYVGPLPLSETIRPPEDIQAFRSVVFRDLLESERAHVAELRGMMENFLEPLEGSQILTQDEYTQLMCNFVEVVEMHEEFLQNLEESNDRVGKVFLTKAPTMKKVHQCYCAAHPRAVVIVDKYRDDLNAFMEKQGAAKPGLLVLTTGLSKPFRRLDKYSAILQELERHMESCHADRGDTQRSIAVYKDIASSCSATRRQKELELQILTGPIRGWQGQELTTLGEIIHMGSVAVGPEHKDRYFVLFPQTLLILSVSQRMSAFKYEGKLPLTGISVNRLEDTDQIKNAFEVTGTLIDRIVAVCQGPSEANKWVDLLSAKLNADGQQQQQQSGKDMKRIVSSSAVNIPLPPPHMSPPTSSTGNSHPSRGSGSITQHMSQHKRSQSFNHHLSYNQVQQQQQHQSQKLLLSNFAASRISTESANPPPSLKGIKEKANWNITNLRPAPPLRPALLNGNGNSGSGTGSAGGGGASIVGGGGGGGGGGSIGSGGSGGLTGSGSVYHSLSLGTSQSTKAQPTYEEDALVLRVIEAYCAAYQSNARNTMHSALQPWAPVLPIRGGKLKTSRHFSSSNPQLPFTCSSLSTYLTNPAAGIKNSQNAHNTASTNSINTSHIWREATPNNFNMYSASICSLNSSAVAAANCRPGPASRYSVGGYGSTEWRSHSEEKPGAVAPRTTTTTTTLLQPFSSPIARSGSNYDNIFMNNNTNTPLLSRVSKQQTVWMNANQVMNYRQRSTSREMEQPLPRRESPPPPAPEGPPIQLPQQSSTTTPLLYDRRLNRSFETAQGLGRTSKVSHMRRSTPQLNGDDDVEEDPLRDDASRNSVSCCNKLLAFYWQHR